MERWRATNGSASGNFSGRSPREEITMLVVLALPTILLWHSPYGGYLLYPFTILSTWFHEMGHGLAGLALGWVEPSGLSSAAIAAAGLLGPTAAGCALILSSQTRRATTAALGVLGIVLLASTLIWVRSLTGWVVLPAIGAACLWLAFRGA